MDFLNSLPRCRAKGEREWWGLKPVSSQTSMMGSDSLLQSSILNFKMTRTILTKEILVLEFVNAKIMENFYRADYCLLENL